MPKIFTEDSTGDKYICDEPNKLWAPGTLGIKPLPKAVEKREYHVSFILEDEGDSLWGIDLLRNDRTIRLKATEEQAEAVAEAIKALLEYINDPKDMQDYDGKTDILASVCVIKAAEAHGVLHRGSHD